MSCGLVQLFTERNLSDPHARTGPASTPCPCPSLCSAPLLLSPLHWGASSAGVCPRSSPGPESHFSGDRRSLSVIEGVLVQRLLCVGVSGAQEAEMSRARASFLLRRALPGSHLPLASFTLSAPHPTLEGCGGREACGAHPSGLAGTCGEGVRAAAHVRMPLCSTVSCHVLWLPQPSLHTDKRRRGAHARATGSDPRRCRLATSSACSGGVGAGWGSVS